MREIKNILKETEKLELTRSKVRSILEYYKKGRGEQHIRTTFGISDITLKKIVNKYSTRQIEEERKKAIEIASSINLGNNMGKSYNDNKYEKEEKTKSENKYEARKNLLEAINNIEPEGEER